MNSRTVVIGVVLAILLGLYLYTMGLEIYAATKCNEKGDKISECRDKEVSPGWGMLFTTVGGMIAAVAVGLLAVAKPEDGPPTAGLADPKKASGQKLAKAIPLVVIGIWIICGVLAVIFGFNNDGSPPLTEMAKAWIGSAVAGVGAFLGIKTS